MSGASPSPVEAVVTALVARDFENLQRYLHPAVRLRAVLPGGFEGCTGAPDTVKRFERWLGKAQSLEVLDSTVEPFADRVHFSYRLREHFAGSQTRVIEQHAFADLEDGVITAIDLLCSGHRSEEKQVSGSVHHFDAGDLGCGTGLPQAFRREIRSIPVGHVLEVLARDPAAKEDLPSLARLLGHRPRSVDVLADGRVVVTVERGT